jgi:hypothetical protein
MGFIVIFLAACSGCEAYASSHFAHFVHCGFVLSKSRTSIFTLSTHFLNLATFREVSQLAIAPGKVFFYCSFFQLDSDGSAFMCLVAVLTTLPTSSVKGFSCGHSHLWLCVTTSFEFS